MTILSIVINVPNDKTAIQQPKETKDWLYSKLQNQHLCDLFMTQKLAKLKKKNPETRCNTISWGLWSMKTAFQRYF